MSILILGAGGLAREVYWHYRHQTGEVLPQAYFVDDVTDTKQVAVTYDKMMPVIKDWNFAAVKTKRFIVGVGSPSAKRAMVAKALACGLLPFDPIVSGATLLGNVRLSKGSIVTSGCVLTTDITVGEYVLLNLGCTVGHDTVIGDFCTLNPGCNISGNVVLGKGVLLGTGTVIREKTRIADDITTGAQSCVVSNLEKKGAIFVGVPAKELSR